MNKLRREFSLKSVDDMPPISYSFSTTLVNKTGSWRYLRPYFLDKASPCNGGCPAGVDVERGMALVGKGELQEAYRLIRQENPFPAVCGRVCAHPCEGKCLRAEFDEPISIRALERFVANQASKYKGEETVSKRVNEKVAIVGSGPAGLACAYHLARMGYQPTVYEALPVAGGMLRVGIPEHRLPKKVLDEEIASIEALGVEVRTGMRIGQDLGLKDLMGEYRAVFLATGATEGTRLGVPGEDLKGVIPGLGFLMDLNLGKDIEVGERVVVIGGGNLAIDTARSALRKGAREVILCSFEPKEEMPAIEEGIREAGQEGIRFVHSVFPQRMVGQDGMVVEVELAKSQGGSLGLRADGVIVAVGRTPDLSLLPELKVDPQTCVTDLKGIFAGGDLIAQVRTVADAISSGKRAAISIDRYLKGENIRINIFGKKSVSIGRYLRGKVESASPVEFNNLNLDYFEHGERPATPRLPLEQAILSFDEVNLELAEETAVQEAKRCFHCGVCTRCDLCFDLCPDLAILKTDEGYEIDYDYCKGCAVCVEECPQGAISLKEEE